jgi:eukaryotic-like serine/threonine-protein kinase
VRAIRRVWDWLRVDWEAGLARLPFFTQRTAVLLLSVLVATLAMLGGVVALVGWPGAGGPTRLVPGERAGQAPASRPEPGNGPAPVPPPRPPRPPAGRRPVARPPGAQGSGGVAGAGAGGPPAAPPTTSPPTTAPQGPLDPVEELIGPVVSTLVP